MEDIHHVKQDVTSPDTVNQIAKRALKFAYFLPQQDQPGLIDTLSGYKHQNELITERLTEYMTLHYGRQVAKQITQSILNGFRQPNKDVHIEQLGTLALIRTASEQQLEATLTPGHGITFSSRVEKPRAFLQSTEVYAAARETIDLEKLAEQTTYNKKSSKNTLYASFSQIIGHKISNTYSAIISKLTEYLQKGHEVDIECGIISTYGQSGILEFKQKYIPLILEGRRRPPTRPKLRA